MKFKRRWVVALCFIALLSYLPMRAHQLGGAGLLTRREFLTISNNVPRLPRLSHYFYAIVYILRTNLSGK